MARSSDPTSFGTAGTPESLTQPAYGFSRRSAASLCNVFANGSDPNQASRAGVNVLSSALLFALRGRIISLVAELGLPAMYQWPETAEEGGLIAYGPSLLGAFRQVTTLVVRVLQGAKPGDLPVEQPTRFSLVINLKTANALGLNIPPLTLTRADRVIG